MAKKKKRKIPLAKIPTYSSEKVLKNLARESAPLVREVEEREIEQDDRSLFFKNEFNNEIKGVRKWIG